MTPDTLTRAIASDALRGFEFAGVSANSAWLIPTD
jgi:hypothetical protein